MKKDQNYAPGTEVEVMLKDKWTRGFIIDNLSIQYCITTDTGEEVFVFKKATDLLRSIK